MTKNLEMPVGGTYLVWQVEKGESGTIHLQGYVEFKTQKTMVSVHKWMPHGAFFARKGTAEQARAYCMKEDTRVEGPWEKGEISKPEQGKRTDLVEFREDAKRLSEDMMHAKWAVEMKMYWRMYRCIVEKSRPGDLEGGRQVILCYGAPGTGKSVYARSVDPTGEYAVFPVTKDMWFNGVTGARVVVLDDFTGAFKLSLYLQVMDRFPQKVPIKGGFEWWNPEVVIITTNIHPMDWWKWEGRECQREAVGRRFTKLLFFSNLENHDLSTVTPVPGCKAAWEQGPMLSELLKPKAVNALDALMVAAIDDATRKRKRDDNGYEQVCGSHEECVDLRKTQEVLPAPVSRAEYAAGSMKRTYALYGGPGYKVVDYDKEAKKAATLIDSDEE